MLVKFFETMVVKFNETVVVKFFVTMVLKFFETMEGKFFETMMVEGLLSKWAKRAYLAIWLGHSADSFCWANQIAAKLCDTIFIALLFSGLTVAITINTKNNYTPSHDDSHQALSS